VCACDQLTLLICFVAVTVALVRSDVVSGNLLLLMSLSLTGLSSQLCTVVR